MLQYHLWTLSNLDAFSNKAARCTFIDHSVDDEKPKLKVSNGRSILNRIVYDAYHPFIELIPGGIQSNNGIINLVRENFSTALQSINLLITALHGPEKKYAGQVTVWKEGAIITVLRQLWECGVFASEGSRSRYLAPPLIHDRGDMTGHGPALQDGPVWDKYDQDDGLGDATKEVTFNPLPKAPDQHHEALPPEAASARGERKCDERKAKRRDIYIAILPFIKPHIYESLPEWKIEELVHECLKTRTFLHSISTKEAIAAVTKLWRGKVFYDADVRFRVLGIKETPEEKRELYREVYFAILPVIRSRLDETLKRAGITRIVRKQRKRKSVGILAILDEKRAIDLVWELWHRRAFHHKEKRQKIIGDDIDNPSEHHQDTASRHRAGIVLPILEKLPNSYGLATGGNTAMPLNILASTSGGQGQSFSRCPTQGLQYSVTGQTDGTPDYSNSKTNNGQKGPFNNVSNMEPYKTSELSTSYSLPTVKAPSETPDQLVSTGEHERSLEDLYRDHPGKSLEHIGDPTLGIAATAIQHVAEEAVFGWLKHWFPQVNWNETIHQESKENHDFNSMMVPKEATATGDNTPSISDLLQKCHKVDTNSDVNIEGDMVDTVSNAIELCRVLKDNKRRVLLERAEDKIRATRSSFYSRIVEIKRQASVKLANLNNRSRQGLATLFFDREGVRQLKEVAILDDALDEAGKFLETSSLELLDVLKGLLDSTCESHPSPVWEGY